MFKVSIVGTFTTNSSLFKRQKINSRNSSKVLCRKFYACCLIYWFVILRCSTSICCIDIENSLCFLLSHSCAPGSICRPRHSNIDQPLCLCPINRYGPTCRLHRQCDPLVGRNPCLNNGQCHIRHEPDNIMEDYICICAAGFFGSLCQIPSSTVHLHYNELSKKRFAVAVLQLSDFDKNLDLLVRRRILYTDAWPQISTIVYDKQINPRIGIVKIVEKEGYNAHQNNRMQIKNSLYLVYNRFNSTIVNVSITFTNANQCPLAYNIFNVTELAGKCVL